MLNSTAHAYHINFSEHFSSIAQTLIV